MSRVTSYAVKRRKSSWLTHTKTGKPVMARSKKNSWNVRRIVK